MMWSVVLTLMYVDTLKCKQLAYPCIRFRTLSYAIRQPLLVKATIIVTVHTHYTDTLFLSLLLQRLPALTCHHQTMEGSLTVVDPLTTDQWVLWLPTAVTLATLSMERAPGLVRVMGLGMSQLQLVKVRSVFSFHSHTNYYYYSFSLLWLPSLHSQWLSWNTHQYDSGRDSDLQL